MPAEIVDRFNKVLAEVYGSNLQRMATALGIDRSTCSRYKTGVVAPSRRTLLALSREAGIDLEWLEHGGGNEIKFSEQSSSESIEAFGLPVFSQPLEGPPIEKSPNRLGMALLAPPPYYQEGRYWVKVGRDLPQASLRAGDYVLLEPCPARTPDADDAERLFAIKREEKLHLDIIQPKDAKRQSGLKVLARSILVHRDLQS